jgi:hypothetical protein
VPATDPKKIEEERFVDLTDLISGCTKNCSLDVFIKRSEKYTINDSPDQVNWNIYSINHSSLFRFAIMSL